MSNGFPPLPVYPYGIDSDRTLYLVANTTEALLTANNDPWAEDVPVKPRKPGQPEVWADNGYANLGGELFYYDAVGKDGNGFVNRLRRCVRNLGGSPTRFNEAGSVVRGYVVAEHHNQLVDAVQRVEAFVGKDFSPDQATLDYRIRNLRAADPIIDDFDCPDVDFSFVVVEDNPATGVLIRYSIQVQGTYNDFTLSFGDGNFTKSVANGEHRYSPNATVDPVVIFSNDKCQVVQSPVLRTRTDIPVQPVNPQAINLTVPTCIQIGDLVTPSVAVPPPDIVQPPIIFPCIDVSPFPSTVFGPISIPSQVVFGPVEVPSIVEFGPVSIPSAITFSPIDVPSLIEFGPLPPLELSFAQPPTIPPIEFGPLPPLGPIEFGPVPQLGPIAIDPLFVDVDISPLDVSVTVDVLPISVVVSPINVNVDMQVSIDPDNVPSIPVDWGTPPTIPIGPAPGFDCIEFCDPPTINVNWGSAPSIPVNITVTCSCSCCPSAAAVNVTEPEFVDNFNPFAPTNTNWLDPSQLEMNYEFQGIPSVIEVMPPDIPAIQVVHDLPTRIELAMPSKTIIEYQGPAIPERVEIVVPDGPISVVLDVPKLQIDTTDLPLSLRLEAPAALPALSVDWGAPPTIQVTGIPSVLELVHNLPDAIRLEMPENPVVQMLAPATPISVVVSMDVMQKEIADEVKKQMQCFALIPCGS